MTISIGLSSNFELKLELKLKFPFRWFKADPKLEHRLQNCRFRAISNARCKFKFKFKIACPAVVIGTCWRGFEMTVSGYDSLHWNQNRLEWQLVGTSVAAGWLYESTENRISNAQPQVSLSARYSFFNLKMLLDLFIHQLQLTSEYHKCKIPILLLCCSCFEPVARL